MNQYSINDVLNAIKNDAEYQRGWVANIAMSFKDEFDKILKNDKLSDVENGIMYEGKMLDIHAIANKAAQNFIDMLTHSIKPTSKQEHPILVERFADNGEHSHWEMINAEGGIIWSEEQLNPSEAIYGLISWLTTRSQPLVLSGKHVASTAVELIELFRKSNTMPNIRENWIDYLVGMGQHEEICLQPIDKMGMANSKYNSRCLQIAEDDEPIFVLLGRDTFAPYTIAEWVAFNQGVQPLEKLFDALRVADQMTNYLRNKQQKEYEASLMKNK